MWPNNREESIKINRLVVVYCVEDLFWGGFAMFLLTKQWVLENSPCRIRERNTVISPHTSYLY